MNKERGERVVLKEAPVERGLHDPKRAWESGGPGLWGVCGGFENLGMQRQLIGTPKALERFLKSPVVVRELPQSKGLFGFLGVGRTTR